MYSTTPQHACGRQSDGAHPSHLKKTTARIKKLEESRKKNCEPPRSFAAYSQVLAVRRLVMNVPSVLAFRRFASCK